MMLTASAQQAGEYVYTDNGRFKITTGENLLTNGDFNEAFDGWTTDGGNALTSDTFAIDTENGNYYLTVLAKENGPGTGSTLLRKLAVSNDKSYVMSYRVRGNDDSVVSSVTSGATVKNYQNFLFSLSGEVGAEDNVSIGKSQTYGFDWATFTYAYTPQTDGYLLVHFFAPYVATCFDDFVVLEAQQVVDDRESAKVIARLQSYLDNPLFPNGHDILEGAIAAIQETVASDALEDYKMYIEYLDEAISEFLDTNTANMTAYLKNGTFDDLKTTSANQRSAGAWTIDDLTPASGKTRWAVKSATEMDAPFVGNYLQNDIPVKYLLRQATVSQAIENMPAAKYMFTMKVRAEFLSSPKNYPDREIRGMKVFANSDSTECWPIEAVNPSSFIAFTELKESGTLKVGFFLPDSLCNHVDIDVTDLRIIGWTQEQVDEFFMGKEFAEARQNLKVSIDSARVWYDNVEMLYGKPQLDSAIVASQNYYETINVTDSLNASRTRLHKEISNYISRNGTLTTFRQTIANAEEMVADNSYSEAGRQTLQTAINTAKAYLATLSADNHLTEGYTNDDIKAQTALLNQAINQLLATNLKGDEKYEFLMWAQQDGAEYGSDLLIGEENAITTSGNATVYAETATFAGHSFNGRFGFIEGLNLTHDASHGLQVNFPSKNKTTMAILNLKAGDQIDIDWAMGNASHGIMIVSANAKTKLADGTWQNYTKTGKDNANVLPKINSDGLSGSVRSTIQMTADGTLDFYQSSSNSTLRVYYLGITYAANVVDGIESVNSQLSTFNSQQVYDLSGRRLTSKPASGFYIQNGKKYVVK